jgi:hypothetical protein
LFPITPTSDLPFQTIAVDFITKLPPSQGFDTILTVTDHDVSKASIFIPCQESIGSEGVTTEAWHQLGRLVGRDGERDVSAQSLGQA